MPDGPLTRRPPGQITPSLQRALGAAGGHQAEARRLLEGLRAADAGAEEAEEITEITERLDALERTRTRPEQVSIGEIELHGPGGMRARIGGLSGWQVVTVLVLVAAAVGAWYAGS